MSTRKAAAAVTIVTKTGEIEVDPMNGVQLIGAALFWGPTIYFQGAEIAKDTSGWRVRLPNCAPVCGLSAAAAAYALDAWLSETRG